MHIPMLGSFRLFDRDVTRIIHFCRNFRQMLFRLKTVVPYQHWDHDKIITICRLNVVNIRYIKRKPRHKVPTCLKTIELRRLQRIHTVAL